MDDHELLLRHTQAWAEQKKRPLDRDLLETAIGLRTFHELVAAQEWPDGSVEHLMLVRWPSHGPPGEPDVEALIETLDTYWRFLRSTGRMRSGSAEPKDLVKEAKRAGAGMREACADPQRHSQSKALLQFAAESGMPLDEAESLEEINERMQQVMEAFNALPFEERDRRLPGPNAPGSVPTDGVSNQVLRALLEGDLWEGMGQYDDFEDDFEDDFVFEDDDEFGEDDFDRVTWDLLPSPLRLAPPPDPADAAQDAQDAAFVHQCLALARWVGEGKPVTATGVLRLAPARETHAELGLWEWERELHRRGGLHRVSATPDHSPEDAERLREQTLAELRSASDSLPLDRLWQACVDIGLLTVGKTTAQATPEASARHTRTEEEWVEVGVLAVASVVLDPNVGGRRDPLLRVLLPFLEKGIDQVDEHVVREWWWSHPDNPLGGIAITSPEDEAHLRTFSDGHVDQLLWQFEDTGVWRRDGQTLHRTALGRECAMWLWEAMEDGILAP